MLPVAAFYRPLNIHYWETELLIEAILSSPGTPIGVSRPLPGVGPRRRMSVTRHSHVLADPKLGPGS